MHLVPSFTFDSYHSVEHNTLELIKRGLKQQRAYVSFHISRNMLQKVVFEKVRAEIGIFIFWAKRI